MHRDQKKSKIKNKTYRYLLVFIYTSFACISMTGCERNNIHGTVSDVFENSVEGVIIKTQNDNITAITNKDGEYSLKCKPGTYTLLFSKKGYTSHMSELSIQNEPLYQVDPVTIYPIPEDNGMYYIGKKKLIKLPESQVRGFSDDDGSKYYVSSKKNNIIIPEGKASFMDMTPLRIAPVHLGRNDLIIHFHVNMLGNIYLYNGIVNEEMRKVGENNIYIRTVDLKPGRYALVEFMRGQMLAGGSRPGPNSVCFPFEVKKSSHMKPPPKDISVGDLYGGGIVAYIYQPNDKEYVKNEIHGIVVSANDLSESDFSRNGYNSENLVLKDSEYYDWRIPNNDEINFLFNNKKRFKNMVGLYGYAPFELINNQIKRPFISFGGNSSIIKYRPIRNF